MWLLNKTLRKFRPKRKNQEKGSIQGASGADGFSLRRLRLTLKKPIRSDLLFRKPGKGKTPPGPEFPTLRQAGKPKSCVRNAVAYCIAGMKYYYNSNEKFSNESEHFTDPVSEVCAGLRSHKLSSGQQDNQLKNK